MLASALQTAFLALIFNSSGYLLQGGKGIFSDLKTKTDYFPALELIYSRKAFFYLTVRELINISMNTDRKCVPSLHN